MKAFTLALVLLGALPAFAEELDKYSQEALEKTMQILSEPMKRGAVISESKRAQDADKKVKDLTLTPENTEKLYALAAQIMQNLVEQSKGDPDAMMKILDKAQKDPSAFANTFTADQKKLLKDLAGDVEKAKGKKVP